MLAITFKLIKYMSTIVETIFTKLCEPPHAKATDIAEWNKLTWGSGANPDLVAAVGLFNWDMTCARNVCAFAYE